VLAACAFTLAAEPQPCERLSQTVVANAAITVAETVPAGTFTPPYGDSLSKLPAFCRIGGVAKPTADSYIRFEVWLPASTWNGIDYEENP
jgi:hypothetical protein